MRTFLISGGSRGLGAAMVDAFLSLGEAVATCSRTSTPKIESWQENKLVAERFHFEALDLEDRVATESFVQRVVDRFGQIDVLVNNAGVARDGVLPLMTEDEIDQVINANLRATLRITRLVTRQMVRQRRGSIINISSVVGLSGYRGLSIYSATKAALDGLTRSLARELGGRGIRVNSIAPGFLRSEMTKGLSEQQLQQIVRRTPLRRLGQAEDVVAAVRFLASPEAGFITGQVLVVDGGLTV